MSKDHLTEAQFGGFFDADGSIIIGVTTRKKTKDSNDYKISFQVNFCITQVFKNKDILDQTVSLFNLERSVTSTKRKNGLTEYKLIIPAREPDGQILLDYFNRNHPILPSKKNDYLIALKILEILGPKRRNLSNVDKVFIIYLCYGNSNQISTSSAIKKKPINLIFQELQITSSEQEKGRILSSNFFEHLSSELIIHKNSLNEMILSKEYMIGFYIGDGTLSTSFKLSKNCKKNLRTVSLIFSWGVVDPDKQFLTCFQRNIGCGRIAGVGKISGNCYRLSVNILREINEKILPILDTNYLPLGRQTQLDTFKQIVSLETNPISRLNPENWEKIIDLAFSMSSKSKRKFSKQDLLILGNRRIKNIKNKNLNKKLFIKKSLVKIKKKVRNKKKS
jgi:hypothetical protein